jgi:hypothetical protein
MSTTWDDVPAGSTERADGLLDDRSVVEILAAFLAVHLSERRYLSRRVGRGRTRRGKGVGRPDDQRAL